VISSFLESWDLLWATFVSGWGIAVLLGTLGVVVVGRDQIFIGAAVTQAATLGLAVALAMGLAAQGWALSCFAVVFSVAATIMTIRHTRGGQTREAITGWVFLFCGGLVVLLLTNMPLNMRDVQQLLISNMIGATAAEAMGFLIAAGAVVGAAAFLRRPLSLWVMDRTMAAGVGLRVGMMELAFAVVLGAALGLALQTAGMLYTFGCLVLPGLIAKQLSRRVGPMFLIAPAVALAAAIVGSVLANQLDYPPGPFVVVLLGALLAPGWAYRRYVKRS